jgi:cytochrome b involved in lipid metabolism
MTTKILLGTALGLLIVVLGAAFFMHTASAPIEVSTVDQTTASSSTTSATGTASSTQTTNSGGITMAQVATHAGASSCWAAINGKVYDLTNWINQHPGGPDKILAICGTDGSAAFNGQHGGERRPESELANFYIGTLTP